jgi:hypothetical protein
MQGGEGVSRTFFIRKETGRKGREEKVPNKEIL